jgi:hypothetical protein
VSDDAKDSIGIPLIGWGYGNMGRRDNLVLVSNKAYKPLLLRHVKPRLRRIFVKPEMRPELRTGDIIFREFDCRGMTYAGCDYFTLELDYSNAERLMRPRIVPSTTRLFASFWTRDGTKHDNRHRYRLGKVDVEGLSLAARPLYVGFVDCGDKYAKGVKGGSTFSGCLRETLAATVAAEPFWLGDLELQEWRRCRCCPCQLGEGELRGPRSGYLSGYN